MDWLKKFEHLDVRIIYWVVFVLLAIPLLRPMGIPLSIGNTSRALFELTESLKPGDVVLMSLDYTPLVAPEVHPAAVAISRHLFTKGVKIAYYGFIEEGPMFGETIINQFTDQFNLVYGQDVINLGFVPGREAGVRALGDDILNTVPRDFRGNVTANMPIMKGIKTAGDFALVVGIGDGLILLVQQMQAVHGVKVAGSSTAAGVSGTLPYVNAGQVSGLLQGLRGAAEYEVMISQPGKAVSMMDAQSIGHLTIIGFILMGNIAYFVQKKMKSKG